MVSVIRLTVTEKAGVKLELLGEENYKLVQKYELFEWRNWRLIPKNQKYWIIENINT